VDSLKAEEGFRAHGYHCSENFLTIGYGRNIDENGGLGITEEEAELLLLSDIDRTVNELERAFPFFVNLDRTRAAVLIELAFNMGLPTLKKFSKMLAALWAGKNNRAAEELLNSRYARQVPARAARYAERLRS
tara:strand:- start:618 stop:1016 length:399 start_codon:yes stop_codon:yes gene_type:complete